MADSKFLVAPDDPLAAAYLNRHRDVIEREGVAVATHPDVAQGFGVFVGPSWRRRKIHFDDGGGTHDATLCGTICDPEGDMLDAD